MPGNPFYTSAAWKALRLARLKLDGWRCVICGTSVSGKGQARVDHRKRISDGGAPLDINNLRTLCPTCDAQGHREKARGGGPREERFVIKGCGPDGWPNDPNHPWAKRG